MLNEQQLVELVETLKAAGGSNLVAVVLYGSAAKQDFDGEFSDVNVLAVLNDASAAVLATIAPAIQKWVMHGHPAPLVFSRSEIEQSTDVFAIEMLDIKGHHRTLYGEELFADLPIPMAKHRIELEHELRTKLLLLRQHYLLAPKENKRTAGLMLDSISSFVTLFRHTLLAFGANPPETNRQVTEELAQRLRFDPGPFLNLLNVREHRMKAEALDVPETFRGYLQGINHVIQAVDAI